MLENIKKKVTNSAVYVKFLRMRDKVTKRILNGLLAFFDIIGPCLSFIFIKTPNPDEISQNVIQTEHVVQ